MLFTGINIFLKSFAGFIVAACVAYKILIAWCSFNNFWYFYFQTQHCFYTFTRFFMKSLWNLVLSHLFIAGSLDQIVMTERRMFFEPDLFNSLLSQQNFFSDFEVGSSVGMWLP